MKRKGFTLVEAIIAVAIVAIIAAIAIPTLLRTKPPSNEDIASNIAHVTKAMELWKSEKGEYPEITEWTAITNLTELKIKVSQFKGNWKPEDYCIRSNKSAFLLRVLGSSNALYDCFSSDGKQIAYGDVDSYLHRKRIEALEAEVKQLKAKIDL